MVQEKTGMNDETGLPHSLTLAEVFDNIRLAPHEIASLLTHLGAAFAGGPQAGLQTKMQEAAARVVNPNTFSRSRRDDVPPDPRNVDPLTGREFTPRRDVDVPTDQPPSVASLNPGGFGTSTSVPVDEPAHSAWQQREPNVPPRVVDFGADNPRREPDANRF